MLSNLTISSNDTKTITIADDASFLTSENEISTINLESNSHLILKILSTNSFQKPINLKINLAELAYVECFFADFASENNLINLEINLNGSNSKSEIKLSSLSKNTRKKYNINIQHNSPRTTSKIEAFGVSIEKGDIEFNCIGTIEEKCIKSNISQQNKIILFDEMSTGKGKPILKIKCDDVIANHGCAIGNLNPEHMYYLMSRGISYLESRKLITFGFLKPIEKYFNENEVKLLENKIEEAFKND